MKRVLIIEDDKDIANFERDYLEVAGLAVEVADTGAVGLNKAKTGDYNLILLDVMLPAMDGFQVCRELRKITEIPIIMVTAREQSIDKIRGLGLGADDYIVKPFDPAELTARVTAHLSRYERLTNAAAGDNDAEEWLTFGGVRVGLKSYLVFVGDEEVKFTNKEFELLKLLAQNPNVVFSKDRLFDRVWGLDAMGDTATVTVHINRIREKIEPDPAKPQYIQTVWGAGYRFQLP